MATRRTLVSRKMEKPMPKQAIAIGLNEARDKPQPPSGAKRRMLRGVPGSGSSR